MSFDIGNIGERNLIQKSQGLTKDGGGGNLGYFNGRRKKQDEDNSSIFDAELEDEFILSEEALECYEKMSEKPLYTKEEGFLQKGINFLENLIKK